MVCAPDQYPWSSHRAYLGIEENEWVTTREILGCFGGTIDVARKRYEAFISLDSDWQSDMSDGVVDGNSTLLSSSELAMPIQHASRDDIREFIDKLVADYCASRNLTPAFIMGTGRQRDAATARAVISHQAIYSGTCTQRDLAEYFNRAPGVISHSIKRYCNATREL